MPQTKGHAGSTRAKGAYINEARESTHNNEFSKNLIHSGNKYQPITPNNDTKGARMKQRDTPSPPPSPSPAPAPKQLHSRAEALALVDASEEDIICATHVLNDARILSEKAGLSVESSILDETFQSPLIPTATTSPALQQQHPALAKARPMMICLPTVFETTGGYSNTDHFVQYTGDTKNDRIAELKRNLKRRIRSLQPERKGEDRWDKPNKISGQRRRRIVRNLDLPSAPPEPPISGYSVYVHQMTAKMRHDRPKSNHDQTKYLKRICKKWNELEEEQRQEYFKFANEVKAIYTDQLREYRATGSYTTDDKYEKLGECGPLVRKSWDHKNHLEQEISLFPMEDFQKRPDYRLKYYQKLNGPNSEPKKK